MQKQKQISGTWLVFLGALFWSLNAPFVKFLNLDALLLCGLRALIAGIALAPFIRPKQLTWSYWMIVYVISYLTLSIGIIVALSSTSSTIAIGMQYTAIIWLFLSSLVITRSFSLRKFFPVLLTFIGVLFFMLTSTSGSSSTGNLIALTEGVSFAFMTVSAKKSTGSNPLGLTAIANLFTAFIVFAFLSPKLTDLGTLSTQEWIIMLILGIVQIGAGYGFYNIGVAKVSSQKASLIALWEMILGPLWCAIFLHEYPSLPVLIGFIIILAGMLLDAVLNNEAQ